MGKGRRPLRRRDPNRGAHGGDKRGGRKRPASGERRVSPGGGGGAMPRVHRAGDRAARETRRAHGRRDIRGHGRGRAADARGREQHGDRAETSG